MARAALRDDLHGVHAQLTGEVLGSTDAARDAAGRVREWEQHEQVVVQRAADTLDEICSDDTADLARMSVALRVVRSLLSNS
jgi:glutamate dehydrogenase